jgi:PAS domain S-box-containing protein
MSAILESSDSPTKILVAEDSRTQAEQLRYILEQNGYEVTVAVNGRLALELATSFRPHLIISDVNMPEMDGYQLSHRLKADADLREIPVILVTTMSDPADVIRGLECGADNFVLKPYEERYLLGRVRYVIANREMRRPDDAGMGVGIHFNGQQHFITADRLQILNLLLSTYEAAIERNKQLTVSKELAAKQAGEVALSNHFLDSVIDQIPTPMFVKDVAELRFVRVNQAMENLLGVSKNKLIGKSVYDLFEVEQADSFNRSDHEALAAHMGSIVLAEDQPANTRLQGTRLMTTKKLVISDEFNEPRYLLGISEDVTEKKQKELEILALNTALSQRTLEANAANVAKSTFLATMSHEIRTPMNGMMGMLELLSLTPLDAQQRDTLQIIRESSESLLHIVDDILDFSKIEAGQLEIYPEVTSVGKILREVERLFSSAAIKKGVVIRHSVDPEINPALMVDAARLRQILRNFVGNSIKFTATGSIDISAELAGKGDGSQRVRFVVRDTGIGISEANQKLLFQPFSQGDAVAARQAGGTGLGLAICRRLAQMMGGTVEMASVLGQGTAMTLHLDLSLARPVDASTDNAEMEPNTVPVIPSKRRVAPDVAHAQREGTLVLVVDDHPINRLLLMRQMNTLGYAAESADDGVQALEKWKSGRFGMILTDCAMPEMDGYELARSIRTLESESHASRIPIVACTANALAEEAQQCIAAGMDACLVKPVSLEGLLEKLEVWLPVAT